MADGGTDKEQRLTTGWKIAIIAALLIALASSGNDQRLQNHEKRINDLENKARSLQADLDAAKGNAPGVGK